MSIRRLSKQQKRRIQKIQQQFQQETEENVETGLVLTRFGKNAEIEDAYGVLRICSIRPNIDSLVAGDRICWLKETDDKGVVVSRRDRNSALFRYTKQGEKKIVAANVTQILIVLAPVPEPSFFLLDCYLAAAQNLHLKPLLLLNKIDLECKELRKELETIYSPLGYSLHLLRQDNETTIRTIARLLKNETNVIVGQSGVGKSSLATRLLPDEKNISVREISTQSQLGKHTTSNSRYYHLPQGGALIDSPGVREFRPGPMGRADITASFKELATLASPCRFRDCDHQTSPGCAILQALEEQKIHPKRYASFCKMLNSNKV